MKILFSGALVIEALKTGNEIRCRVDEGLPEDVALRAAWVTQDGDLAIVFGKPNEEHPGDELRSLVFTTVHPALRFARALEELREKLDAELEKMKAAAW